MMNMMIFNNLNYNFLLEFLNEHLFTIVNSTTLILFLSLIVGSLILIHLSTLPKGLGYKVRKLRDGSGPSGGGVFITPGSTPDNTPANTPTNTPVNSPVAPPNTPVTPANTPANTPINSPGNS